MRGSNIQNILSSRPGSGRVMIERVENGAIVARRYGSERRIAAYQSDGWQVWIPAKAGGWKLAK